MAARAHWYPDEDLTADDAGDATGEDEAAETDEAAREEASS
jgi:hypothetical protein